MIINNLFTSSHFIYFHLILLLFIITLYFIFLIEKTFNNCCYMITIYTEYNIYIIYNKIIYYKLTIYPIIA